MTLPVPDFDVIQTFYADPDRVAGSGEVLLTSVDLYFKSVPDVNGNTTSGKTNPGVVVYLCKTKNDEPDITNTYWLSRSRLTRDQIAAYSDASSAVTFPFAEPVKVDTGQSYGIVVKFDDPGFELWENVAGDPLVGTSNPSPGSNLVKDGKLFYKTNTDAFKARANKDLKFAINCAKYTQTTASETYVNPGYEFFTISSVNGRFKPGELAWQTVANGTGTVAFTAGDRFFTANTADFDTAGIVTGDQIVLFSNSSYSQVVTIKNVVSNNYIETINRIVASNNSTNWMKPPVGQVYKFDGGQRKLYLKYSNATSSLKFAANNNVLYGEDSQANCLISSIDNVSVDRVKIGGDAGIPVKGNINLDLSFAEANTSSGFDIDLSRSKRIMINQQDTKRWHHHNAHICSRSIEVDQAGLFRSSSTLDDGVTYEIDRVSAIVNASISINQSNTNLYSSPKIPSSIDTYVYTASISNTYTTTDANSVTIDSEINGPYNALSKHITKKVTFANNKFAEDIRCYMTAYRPANSNILVYARVHNSADSDAFDDHAWTPLEYVDNANKYSSSEDENDFIEFELGLQQYPDTANALPGTFSTTLASNSVSAAGVNPTTYLASGDLIKLYNPLIPEDYIIDVVSAANSSVVTLENSIANNNVVGSGFKVDRLKYYNTAFNNITNDNVARYYNSSKVEFDKFDSMQIKIVFLSDTSYVTPRVDQIQVIGVSA